MLDCLELSTYELGIINNTLRFKVIELEESRSYETLEDFEESEGIDAFCLELLTIKYKIRHIISERSS